MKRSASISSTPSWTCLICRISVLLPDACAPITSTHCVGSAIESESLPSPSGSSAADVRFTSASAPEARLDSRLLKPAKKLNPELRRSVDELRREPRPSESEVRADEMRAESVRRRVLATVMRRAGGRGGMMLWFRPSPSAPSGACGDDTAQPIVGRPLRARALICRARARCGWPSEGGYILGLEAQQGAYLERASFYELDSTPALAG